MLRYLHLRWKRFYRNARAFVLYRILHVDDPPEKLAKGIAIGVFLTFTPTIGVQMGLNVLLAWILKANKTVGIPIVWISNPVTLIPIYYPLYLLGAWIGGIHAEAGRLTWWKELVAKSPEGWWPGVKYYWDHLLVIAGPLWLGCLIVAIGLAVPSYFLSLSLIRSYRIRKWGDVIPPSAQAAASASDSSAAAPLEPPSSAA